MKNYRIAFIPGDGVGPEVALETRKTLEECGRLFSFAINSETFAWDCDYYLEHGRMMPENALEILKGFDAIFLGSVGDPSKAPDHVSLSSLLEIRKGFDLYVNLRPIILHKGVPSPITTATPETVDMVVVRENTEGEYARLGGIFAPDAPNGFATQMAVFSRKGCERVMRYAFELARTRKAQGYKGKVTSCTKSNALNYSMVYWDTIFREVAAEYPDIETNYLLVDALSMIMITDPGQFDVIVASNLFGDIITDLGSVLQGGIGVAAGANLDPERRFPSMFEPIHGSALALAGKGVVNPIASIESGRMMLEYLGETEAAGALLKAVQSVLAKGDVRTRDMGGQSGTAEVGDAIRAALKA
ncbi:3-isopropylmalate dehydrogenase [Desulfovibrio sp. OttesenSCG-928-I05]|nr:3-isopropylmalate dehydrogenase [Desulfovibrio sp. OttesenSCG-928-I05]